MTAKKTDSTSSNSAPTLNRRGVLAALLCSPAMGIAQRDRTDSKSSVELKPDFILEVRYGTKIVRLNADDIMGALKAPVRDILGHPIAELPIVY